MIQLERGFTLWKNLVFTIDMLNQGKSKVKNLPNLPKTMNAATGKASNRDIAFTEANWKSATRGYLKSIRALNVKQFDDIINEAKDIAAATSRNRAIATLSDEGDSDSTDDERALLIEGCSDEESSNSCKYFSSTTVIFYNDVPLYRTRAITSYYCRNTRQAAMILYIPPSSLPLHFKSCWFHFLVLFFCQSQSRTSLNLNTSLTFISFMLTLLTIIQHPWTSRT